MVSRFVRITGAALEGVVGGNTYRVMNKVMPFVDDKWQQSNCVERMSTILSKYSVGAGALGATAFALQWLPKKTFPWAHTTSRGLQGGLIAATPTAGVIANNYLMQCNRAEPGNGH